MTKTKTAKAKAAAKAKATNSGNVKQRKVKANQVTGPRVSSPGRGNSYTFSKVIQSNLSLLGNSEAGRDYALCNLDPCGEHPRKFQGIPDPSQATCVTPVIRDQYTATWDATLFDPPLPTPPTGNFEFDVHYVITSIPEIPMFYWLVYGGYQSRVVWFRSITFPLDQTDTTSTQASTLESDGVVKFRFGGRGATVDMSAASVANQGEFYACSFDPQVDLTRVDLSTAPSVPAGSGSGTLSRGFVYVPQSIDEMVQMDPVSVQHQAKMGAYHTLKYTDPAQQYTACLGGSTLVNGIPESTPGTTAPYNSTALCLLQTAGSTETGSHVVKLKPASVIPYTWEPMYLNTSVSPDYCMWGFSGFGNQQWIKGAFVGISNGATLKFKIRSYIEGQIAVPRGIIACFSHPSPTLDSRAMETIAMCGQELPHTYPASYNSLGKLFANILRIVPGVAKMVGGWNVPIVSKFANMVGDATQPVVDYFG